MMIRKMDAVIIPNARDQDHTTQIDSITITDFVALGIAT